MEKRKNIMEKHTEHTTKHGQSRVEKRKNKERKTEKNEKNETKRKNRFSLKNYATQNVLSLYT